MSVDDAVASTISSSVAILIHIAAITAVLLASQQLIGDIGAQEPDPGHGTLARSLAHYVAASPGDDVDWSAQTGPGTCTDQTTMDTIGGVRLGLRVEDEPYLDWCKVRNLQRSTLTGSTSARMDYEDARRGLGLVAHDLGFHVRTLPRLPDYERVEANPGSLRFGHSPGVVAQVGSAVGSTPLGVVSASVLAADVVTVFVHPAAQGLASLDEQGRLERLVYPRLLVVDETSCTGLQLFPLPPVAGTPTLYTMLQTPGLIDILVVGSDVNHGTVAGCFNFDGLGDVIQPWVEAGGTLIVLGSSSAATASWQDGLLNPVVPPTDDPASRALFASDPFHPFFRAPNRLAYEKYQAIGTVFDAAGRPDALDTLQMDVVGPVIQLSREGALGQGRVILLRMHPTEPQGATNPPDVEEGGRLLHNALLRHFASLHLDYGRPMPGGIPFAAGVTGAVLELPTSVPTGDLGQAMRSGHPFGNAYVSLRVEAYVFPSP